MGVSGDGEMRSDSNIMFLREWILLCSALVMAGWILSVFTELKILPYTIFLLVAACWIFRELMGQGGFQKIARKTIRRLVSLQLLPCIFGLSVLLLLVKGLLTNPGHDDGLCYRIPRVMNWIMEHKWHWITAEDVRLNTRGTVSEWLTVPIMLLIKNDRFVFIPNWISHLFLPGLIFSVWRHLGVSPRLAWIGMWVIPSGYCFALQAVNSSNDSIGTFFLLAAFHYALKQNDVKSWQDVMLSTMSIALATGVKLNYLPFIFPWAIAMGRGWCLLSYHPMRLLLLGFAAILVSFLPNGLMNWLHGAGFSGLRLEPILIIPPFYIAYLGNFFLIAVHNLIEAPITLMGGFRVWYAGVKDSPISAMLDLHFQRPAFVFYPYVAIEEAGLGFWVALLICFLLILSHPGKDGFLSMVSLKKNLHLWMVVIGLWMVFFHYMFLANSNQPARIISPFYAMLIPTLLKGRIFKSNRYWKRAKIAAGMVMIMSLYSALVLTENSFVASLPSQNIRDERELYFQGVARQYLPPDEKNVGIIRFWNERESWLWRPYGSRKVIELPYDSSAEEIINRRVRYVFVSNTILRLNNENIVDWAKKNRFQQVVPKGKSASRWYLVESINVVCRDGN